MGIFLLLFVGIVCAGYTGQVAGAKGYDAGTWALGGFLFGPLALLASLGLPDRKLRRYVRLLAEHQGAVIEDAATAPSPVLEEEDVDAQRRRILGRK